MLKQELLRVQGAVEAHLTSLLKGACEGVPARLAEAMTYGALKGGKRLRPFLHMMTARLFEGDEVVALDIACSLELMHSYSLIHDDLPGMDNSPLRRGKPSVQAKFDHHTAILAGSALQNLSFELLTQLPLPEGRRLRLIQHLAQASGARGMMGGQQLDMDAEKSLTSLTLDDISHLQDLKTGALISYALESAHIAFGLDEKIPTCLALYGKNIGLAYQITDDLMDLKGTSQEAGKPIQADQHKASIVTHLGLEKAESFVKSLVDEACISLAPYSANAYSLQELAKSLLGRVA